MRDCNLHFLLPEEQALPEQIPGPLPPFRSELTLLTFAAGDGKRAGGLYPVSAYKLPRTYITKSRKYLRTLYKHHISRIMLLRSGMIT